MSDLIEINERPLAKTASDECSQALWQSLTSKSYGFLEAADRLAASPEARQELAVALPQLERHGEPCGAKAVIAQLAPLAALYGVSDKSEGEWKAFWRFYVDALSTLPLHALKDAVTEYVGDAKSEFFPKPGPLKAMAERHAAPIWTAVSRARRALAIPW